MPSSTTFPNPPADRGWAPAGRALASALLCIACSTAARSQEAAEDPKLRWYGDARLRFERDWDSEDSAGAARDDRDRGRIRARMGLAYEFDAKWTAGLRVRTGNSRSQQSPHLTFASDSGGRDDFDGLLDKYFLHRSGEAGSVWIGRNSFPFWQQNEYFWDDDVTPTGAAASFGRAAGEGHLGATVGAFALPDGGYDLHGSLLAGQVKYDAPSGPGRLTVAGALHRFDGEAGAKRLRNGNGRRDYLIAVLSGQWTAPLAGRPLALGIDLFENLENYSAAEAGPYAANRADDTTGYVLSAKYGQLKQRGDWQFAYAYAYIETFAVNASFAQDDWARFGSATQTDGSDCKGHDLSCGYGLGSNLNLVARLFVVDAISSTQDGNRFRADLNWKF